VADERILVAAGIHSRRRAAAALGIEDITLFGDITEAGSEFPYGGR
jgi:hypothetical protein